MFHPSCKKKVFFDPTELCALASAGVSKKKCTLQNEMDVEKRVDVGYAIVCFTFFACVASIVCITVGGVNLTNHTGTDSVSYALIGIGVAVFIFAFVAFCYCLCKCMWDTSH